MASAQAMLSNSGVPDELIRARDELLELLGGAPAIAQAHSTAGAAGLTLESGTEALGLENIACVYIGTKFTGGRPTPSKAIKVQVVEKPIDKDRIESYSAIPPVLSGGIYTDVEQVGRIVPFASNMGTGVKVRGVNSVGTLGSICSVRKGGESYLCILSNNHVLADVNRAPIGSAIDAERTGEYLADLLKFEPLKLSSSQNSQLVNLVDCAVAWTDESVVVPYPPGYPDSGPQRDPGVATDRMPVWKWGRTTGYTHGRVTGLGAHVFTGYDNGAQVGSFNNQIIITGDQGAFSAPGDSGSVVLDYQTNRIIGLLFAGTQVGTPQTYVNPIQAVMSALDIEYFIGS